MLGDVNEDDIKAIAKFEVLAMKAGCFSAQASFRSPVDGPEVRISVRYGELAKMIRKGASDDVIDFRRSTLLPRFMDPLSESETYDGILKTWQEVPPKHFIATIICKGLVYQFSDKNGMAKLNAELVMEEAIVHDFAIPFVLPVFLDTTLERQKKRT